MEEINKHETLLRVRYQETDQMGVVHHSNYAVWFEAGRTAMIRDIGISYSELEQNGILLPVVDLHCRFISPARYEEEIRVLTGIQEIHGPKISFCYEVCRDDQLLVRGETIHLWTNREMKRLNLEKKNRSCFKNCSNTHFPLKRRNESVFRILVLILIVVPALEIWGLVKVGEAIGAWPTALAVIATGVAGGYLARWQGASDDPSGAGTNV